MGEGATRQGSLHETFNMASFWKLPVVFIIENNNYAMGTSVERTSKEHDYYKLGIPYGMHAYQVDGMRCENVHAAIEHAVNHARKGNGPTLLEMKTYRFKGHSMSDASTYRTKEEVEVYKENGPIANVLKTITKNKWANKKDLEAINNRVKDVIEECIKFGEESPYPDEDELYKDVYAQTDYPFIKE